MEKSLQVAKEITNLAYLHGNHNILIDAKRHYGETCAKLTDMMQVTLKSPITCQISGAK